MARSVALKWHNQIDRHHFQRHRQLIKRHNRRIAPAEATFAEIYRIGTWELLDNQGYAAFPSNSELEGLGMSGRSADMPDCLAFELEPLEHYAD